ncbi:MAG TPA: hypothetical protein VD838_00615, partial [Anaeromyxobacteraceae bacterium]|nr:hypothetical protein [Anaeromyxobacteraceae bacterium]
MNRVKLWVYVVLAVGSGALFLRSSSIDAMARARAGIDRRLTTASTSSASALHALDGQAAAIAVLAAADPGLQQATLQAAEPLSPPRGKRPASAPVPDEATREQQRLAAARAAASSAAVT